MSPKVVWTFECKVVIQGISIFRAVKDFNCSSVRLYIYGYRLLNEASSQKKNNTASWVWLMGPPQGLLNWVRSDFAHSLLVIVTYRCGTQANGCQIASPFTFYNLFCNMKNHICWWVHLDTAPNSALISFSFAFGWWNMDSHSVSVSCFMWYGPSVGENWILRLIQTGLLVKEVLSINMEKVAMLSSGSSIIN